MSEEPCLFSGEFHYFRVPRTAWADRLAQMADAGLDTACIYVPWNWHQPDPATLDLTGRTIPERDLLGALDAIASAGLQCIYRPGPFITAEWRNGGIPDWLLDSEPAIRALDASGSVSDGGGYPLITYAHPRFVETSQAWLRTACEAIVDRLCEHGGFISAVQLDDEPSYWQSLGDPFSLDYHPLLVSPVAGGSPWAKFLLERHGSMSAVASAHDRPEWSRPEDIEPPRQPMSDGRELARYLDWLDFKLDQINRYVAICYETARGAGMVGRLMMLYPYLSSLQAKKFSSFADRMNLDLHLTDECYLSLMGSYAGAEEKIAAVISTHEAYHLWRGVDHGPPVAMEIQSSNASYLPPGAMELLYALTAIRGVRGMNFYMMVGGKNPPGFENETGSEYDICAPISVEGKRRPHFDTVAKIVRVMRTMEPEIHEMRPLIDVSIGVHLDYDAASMGGAALALDAWGLQTLLPQGEMGLSSSAGLQSLLATSSISWNLVDIADRASPLEAAHQCWVGCLDFLAAPVQQRLVDYAAGGGHLVLLPALPTRDDTMAPCDVLARAVFPGGKLPAFAGFAGGMSGTALVRDELGRTIVGIGRATSFDLPAGSEALAFSAEDGRPCACTQPFGQGRITFIGFRLGYDPDGGPGAAALCRRIVEWDGTSCAVSSSDPQIAAFEMAGPSGGLVCVVNPVDAPAATRATYTRPCPSPAGAPVGAGERSGSGSTGEPNGSRDGRSQSALGHRTLPALLDSISMPGRGARLLPVEVSLGAAGTLVQATAELIGRHLDDGRGTITLLLHVTQPGLVELVVRGAIAGALATTPAGSIAVTGGSVAIVTPGPEPAETTVVIQASRPGSIECRLTSDRA
ncbi:MAG: beta-galactosidase [Actinomycetota bacterium]|nr:beta-galactosidase [Actinomycetota bacterium]